MPKFEITDPTGRRFEVTAPEGATKEQVLEFARTRQAPKPEPEYLNPHEDPYEEVSRYGKAGKPTTDPLSRALTTTRRALAAPYRLAGKLDVAAGNRTPEQADERAQEYGDLTGLALGGRFAKPLLGPALGAAKAHPLASGVVTEEVIRRLGGLGKVLKLLGLE